MKLRFRVKLGALAFHGSRQWVRMRFSELVDGEYDMVIKHHVKQRSNQQNAYYWGVVVNLVEQGLRDAGYDEIRSPDDAHEVLKSMFFKKVIHSEKCDNLEQIISTTKFSTTEFAEKIEMIIKWAYEFLGITIPLPNSQAALDFNGVYDEQISENNLPDATGLDF